MHAPTALVTAGLLAGAAVLANLARADSLVVRDTRLTTSGGTPALGRGYTPAISSLHGVCFDRMPTTTASYDLDYTFEELEVTARGPAAVKRAELKTYEIDEFLRGNMRARTYAQGAATRHIHYLLATLIVDSYYASIDESLAELSRDGLKLLGAGDVHGFFTGCGTHYIRSLSRRSYFLTLFSYTASSSQRDRAFELRLEHQVRRFHAAPSPSEQHAEQAFADQARSQDLRVVTRSIGLPSRKDANLLPLDLASYKQSVREAFKASQEPGAGRITAMEVVAWLSNPRVLVALDLGAAGADPSTWIERKRILADNAEFYIELVGALQQMNTQVHRAEACRRELDQTVMRGGTIAPRYAGARAISHRTGARRPLAELVDALSDASIDRMRAMGLAWRDGPDGKSGAQACMKELERTALSGRYHNSIPSCAWQRVVLPNAALIEELCPLNLEEAAGSVSPP